MPLLQVAPSIFSELASMFLLHSDAIIHSSSDSTITGIITITPVSPGIKDHFRLNSYTLNEWETKRPQVSSGHQDEAQILRTMIESLFLVERRQEKRSQDQGGKSGGQYFAASLHHFLAEIHRCLKYSHCQELCEQPVRVDIEKH
jgi:hypothetical protein